MSEGRSLQRELVQGKCLDPRTRHYTTGMSFDLSKRHRRATVDICEFFNATVAAELTVLNDSIDL